MSDFLDQLRFYLTHSWNDLRVNRRQTAFALLSIGAGVAAIVSLQLLTGMIGDTFTGSLQESNRGDIFIQNAFANTGFDSEFSCEPPDDCENDPLTQALANGYLVEREQEFGFSQYFITMAGAAALQGWAAEQYPGQLDISQSNLLTGELGIFLGSGMGTSMNVVGRGAVASNLSPQLVDRHTFPLYGSIRSLDDVPLGKLLQSATDIVIDAQTAQELALHVGDTVRLNGSSADFTVRGMVAREDVVRDPLRDFWLTVFGFYYLDNSASALFADTPPLIQQIYVRLARPELVDSVSAEIQEAFPFFELTTTSEIATQNEGISDALRDLVTVMGMISLLIGSIGVINTMQVVVRRRMQEIAILKTLGLQGRQVNLLLLTESFLMGLLGSLFGLALGVLLTLLLEQAAENIVAKDLVFRLRATPLWNGLVVGTLVATVFGLLPTLTAALIRPAIILRPSELHIPRVGILRMLLALLVVVLVLTGIANTFLNNLTWALLATGGAFLVAGLVYFLLNLIIWLFGRFFPSFGFVDLKLAWRQILSARARAATTLLALVVGVFSLSTITLFAQATMNIFDAALSEQEGNLQISLQDERQLPALTRILDGAEGVHGRRVTLRYDLELVSLLESDGAELDRAALEQRMLAHSEDSSVQILDFGDTENRAEFQLRELDSLSEWEDARLAELEISRGRALSEADRDPEAPGLLLYDQQSANAAGIDPGDRLIYRTDAGEEITLTVVGLIETEGIRSRGLSDTAGVLMSDTLPLAASQVIADVDVDAAQVAAVRAEVSTLPGAFALDTAIFGRLLEALLHTFVAFPQLVAALGLLVGGVVIANSVALSTLERRREIAVMKSVGLQRERVLFMLLLENGLLGLLGGLVGVGIGLVALMAIVNLSDIPRDAVPYLSAFALMGLCVLVALAAAAITAWGAAGERPLNVLRYE